MRAARSDLRSEQRDSGRRHRIYNHQIAGSLVGRRDHSPERECRKRRRRAAGRGRLYQARSVDGRQGQDRVLSGDDIMATIAIKDGRQVIDYLARDYNSFRQALIDLIPAKLPEWTDRSEADFGIVLIELFAYMGDILSYYQDRIANEAFLTTAQERRSVINHLRLIGYEMAPAAPAAARLGLIVANNVNQVVEIRKGDQFATASSKDRKSLTFEYVDDKPLVINLADVPAVPPEILDKKDLSGFSGIVTILAKKPDGTLLPNSKEVVEIKEMDGAKTTVGVIPVREGRSINNEALGVSTGAANQRFQLGQPRALIDTLRIVVETSPPTQP